MTEREELEYAAKAGCYLPKDFINNKNYMDGFLEKWNPREDDGDCGRLESALGIDILWLDKEGFVTGDNTLLAPT